jgi:hypothetical protein
MKNVIIVVLGALSAFLAFKLYDPDNTESSSLKHLNETGFFTYSRIDTAMSINVDSMINHFHKHTLKKLSNQNDNSGTVLTDGKVTMEIRFDTVDIKKGLALSENGQVTFYLASFEKNASDKYVKYMNKKYPKDKINLSEVVQKPTVVLQIGKEKAAPKYAIGKICPPPANCP